MLTGRPTDRPPAAHPDLHSVAKIRVGVEGGKVILGIGPIGPVGPRDPVDYSRSFTAGGFGGCEKVGFG